jgi:flagellar motility protein MotE (MotC chaperone)
VIKFAKLRKLNKAGRGSVVVIALLLVSSGLLRVTSGMALAEDTAPLPKPLPETVEPEMATLADQSAAMHKPSRVEMASLLESLTAREALLKDRERQFELRRKAIAVADEEIAKRLIALEEAETALRATLSLADGAAEDDIARLTSVYENMKPKDAAALFETMEPDFAAGFLGRMRPDKAAAVMTGLSPDVAYSISVILAGRNANVPKT